MLLSCCSCNKTAVPSPEGCPELDGTFAALKSDSGSGRADIVLSNASVSLNISSTWKIDSPSYFSFSPDGTILLFEGRENYKWNVYSYDITSGKLPVNLTGEIAGDCRHPQFCPDGKILYSKAGQIVMADLSGSESTPLTFGANTEYDYPAMSPDGKYVLYTDGRKLQKLEISSLSGSSLNINAGAKIRAPFYIGEDVFYVEGNSLRKDGKPVLDLEGRAVPAFGDWVLLSLNGKGYIGNVATKEKYEVLSSVTSECAYSGAKVEIAVPEDGGRGESPSDDITSDRTLPRLKGKLVYHNYTSYDAMDSRMYIYDFSLDRLTEISKGWTVVRHPMNGHFSHDGKYLTFMGIGTETGSWDIFLYELGSSAQPVNLTPEGSYRDEDPKFSYASDRICFKRNDHLSEILLSDRSIRVLSKTNEEPFSMPYYTTDDSKLLFGGGHNPQSYIALWNIASGTYTKLYDKANTVEYYPVTIDAESFYFTRHVSETDTHDQLYKGYFDGSSPEYLAFNKTNADYSDACAVSSQWLILVSTRPGSKGGYDMYIAHEKSGAIYSLSDYNSSLNTTKNELGPDYIPAL